MTKARDIMSTGVRCVRESETVLDAARRMAETEVGALPICGEDGRLRGMLTDRDIVVRVLAEGKDPRAVHAGELADGSVVTVDADDDTGDVLRTMATYRIRRVPVLADHRLVGVVSQADVARSLPDDEVGELVEALSLDT
jgi:CBS domain-containing protein